jgi:hypothetical protein
MKISVDRIVDLAREVEITDPIDWGMLNVSEDHAYMMIGCSVAEMFENIDEQDKDEILLSIIIKLTVENFVLNLKLLGK